MQKLTFQTKSLSQRKNSNLHAKMADCSLLILHNYYPCDKQGYCNRVLKFFIRKQLCPQNSSGLTSTLFNNVFKILSVPCQVSPEVTNMPGMAKVLGSSLTRTCFFFKHFCKMLVLQKKLSTNCLSAYLLSACLSHLEIIFFSTRIFKCCFFSV